MPKRQFSPCQTRPPSLLTAGRVVFASIILTLLLMLSVTREAIANGLPDPLTDEDFAEHSAEEVALGHLLFYDAILSGNRNIACATCHHPRFATGDGVSLGLGEGASGLSTERRPDPDNMPEQRIPRNSPALFNLGAHEVTVLFHDGRIEVDPDRPGGLRTPLDDEMVEGFASLLSAQTMFPVLSPDEMAGHYQENDIAKAVRQGRLTGDGGAWDLIADRVASIAQYQDMFEDAYPEIEAGREIAFTDISNAIAAFIAIEFRSDQSPFDAYLRNEGGQPPDAIRGLNLFYADEACAQCHSGPLLSDFGFHAMGQPQIGPGKAERFESHQRDVGRMRVTGRAEDAYAFRTPSLRNVTETGPWGHAGAFADLRAFLRHHVDPVAGLDGYQPQAVLPELMSAQGDWQVMDDNAELARISASAEGNGRIPISDDDISDLLAFLASLKDEVAIEGRLGVPDAVPSGLPVDH